jgi:putative flavoprotein involved in K+ transport
VNTETAILGAGPAGLAAAACLARKGRGYLLLEAGEKVAAGLRRLDPGMRLVSPAPLCRLPEMENLSAEATYLELGRYLELLERYREQREIAVRLRSPVLAVGRGPGGLFEVRHGGLEGPPELSTARFVINATGVIGSPVLPADFDPATFESGAHAIDWCHSREARPARLAAARSLLVVGGGISADDLIRDWLENRREGERAAISLRSPLRLAPKTLLGIDVHYWVRPAEVLPILPLVWRKFRTNPILGSCLPAALRSGALLKVPAVSAYRRDRVELADGRELRPDLIVFATGYRYSTPHLGQLFAWPDGERPRARRCESLDAPGLFLLGLHFGRNFASPYLRGIAGDAEYVAAAIARRGGR